MPLRKGQQAVEQHTNQAVHCMQNAASMLNPDRATLSNFDKAAASLSDATGHIDRATAHTDQNPSTTIILQAAANAATTAHDHLDQVHKNLEDAYIDEQSVISPTSVKNTLQKAASAALKSTHEALDLMEEAGAAPQPPFIPPELVHACRNRAVLSIITTALFIAAGLAVYETRTFALYAAITAFISQQSTMMWALISSTQPTSSTRRADFYATLAVLFTILLSISILTTGLPPRAVVQITGMALLPVIIEWAIARAMASHSQKQNHTNRR